MLDRRTQDFYEAFSADGPQLGQIFDLTLRYEMRDACRSGGLRKLVVLDAAHRDHGCTRIDSVLPFEDRRDAGRIGQVQVEQNHIEIALAETLPTLGERRRLCDLEAARFGLVEETFEHGVVEWVV